MVMTAIQLLKATPSNVASRARSVRVAVPKPANLEVKDKVFLGLAATAQDVEGSRQRHKMLVLASKAGTPLHKAPLIVSCDCGFFAYYCEYALHKKKASVIRYSNGEPPVERNPNLVPMVCKHLHSFLTTIQQQRM